MERIKVSNFRKVKDSWDLDLAPITFFTGKNNSGKSSVLKSLMVLSDFVNSNNHFFLNFDGEFANKHSIKAFGDAKNRTNKGSKQINFEFKNKESTIELVFEDIEEEEYFRLIREYFRNPTDEPVLDAGKIKRGVLNLLKITREDGKVFSIVRNFGLEYQIIVDVDLISTSNFSNEVKLVDTNLINSEIKKLVKVLNETFDIPKISKLEEVFEIDLPVKIKLDREWINGLELARVLLQKKKASSKKFDEKKTQMYNPSFSLTEIFDNDKLLIDKVIIKTLLQYFEIESTKNKNDIGAFDNKTEANKLLKFSEWIMEQLSFELYHLSPNRASQSKIYNIEDRDLDINNLLYQYSKSPFFNYTEETFFNESLEFFDIPKLNFDDNEELSKPITLIEENLYTIKLVDESIGEIHLKDQGYGIGQLFTIIFQVTLLLKKRLFENQDGNHKKRIIIIEEPEANLHPKLQSMLTEFFLKITTEYGIQFILETHSEYILRQSQVHVKNFYKNSDIKHEMPFRVYYFDENKGPYKMSYDDEGKFIEDFGSGFFDVSRKLTRNLL